MPLSVWHGTPSGLKILVSFGSLGIKMLAVSPNKIYLSHGSPFLPQDLVKYRHFLDQRKLIPPAK